MDLADTDAACASVLNVRCLLERAKSLNDAIDAPGASNDDWFQRVVSDTYYNEQLHGTTKCEDRPPAFPQLLAAFDAAVEKSATPAQKKKMEEQKSGYNYNLTHFLGAMSQQ